MEGIQQMFHELSGYEEYQLDLFSYLLRKRAAADAIQQRYEAKPFAIEKRRARQRAYWKRKHPPKRRAFVNQAAKREQHRLRMQAWRAEQRAA